MLHGLKVLGLDKDTLIIFTSDNGPAPTFERQRTIGLRGAKNSLYEGGIRMPFIAYWSETIESGQVDHSSLVSAVDIFPTLCAIAGASIPDNIRFDGENFSKSLVWPSVFKRSENLYWEYGRFNPKYSIPKIADEVSPALAVRQGDWKCFTSFDGKDLELYNLASDPNETHNVTENYPEMAEKLKQEMLDWFAENNESELRRLR